MQEIAILVVNTDIIISMTVIKKFVFMLLCSVTTQLTQVACLASH